MHNKVKHLGITTTGSPLTIYLFEEFLVIWSKCSAHWLFPTLGAPKVITWILSNILAWLISIKDITDKPPPKLIPEI